MNKYQYGSPAYGRMQKRIEAERYMEQVESQLIRTCFDCMTEMLGKGNEINVPLKPLRNGTSKSRPKSPRPIPTYKPKEVLSSLPAYVYAEHEINGFRDIWNDVCAGAENSTVINLANNVLRDEYSDDFSKVPPRMQKANGVDTPLGRTVIRIILPKTRPIYLHIDEGEDCPVLMCVGKGSSGYVFDNMNKRGLLFFEWKPGGVAFIRPTQLCVLSITGKTDDGEKGIFTMFQKRAADKHSDLWRDITSINSISGEPDISHARFLEMPWDKAGPIPSNIKK